MRYVSENDFCRTESQIGWIVQHGLIDIIEFELVNLKLTIAVIVSD